MTAANAALDKQGQQQRLMAHLFGYQATWIIDIGLKSGLLRAIADGGGIDEKTLAQRLGFAERYVAVWCRAAYAFELIEWNALRGYALSAALRDLLLDTKDPLFMAGRIATCWRGPGVHCARAACCWSRSCPIPTRRRP